MSSTGTLYVVATPIGNLEDLTARAARVLRHVPLVAAEDTRVTRKLLSHLGAHPRLVSYNEHNAERRTPALLAALAAGDVALVTDAGVPGISDPGAALVAAAAAAGHIVVPVPGPSAVTAALAAAGMPAGMFRFVGFPPRARKPRLALARSLATEPGTLVFFEAPHRVRETLADLREALGDRRVAVCRELTKLHEEVFRGTLAGALAHFTEPRGEFVIVVAGAPRAGGLPGAPANDAPHVEAAPGAAGAPDLRTRLAELRASGASARDAVAQAARELGVKKREAYREWVALG